MNEGLNSEAMFARSLRGLMILMALMMAWLLLSLVWVPQVASVAPPVELLTTRSHTDTAVSSPVSTPTYDFVDRPLFLAGRRPVVNEPLDDVQSEPLTTEVVTLDGFSLMGVFSSGGVEGVMLKSEQGESLRLYLGQDLEGLQLTQVESRGALFSAPEKSGRPDVRLAMELGVIPMPVSGTSATDELTEEVPSAENEPQFNPLSFEGMDAMKVAQREKARARQLEALRSLTKEDMMLSPSAESGEPSGYQIQGTIGSEK